MKRDGDCVDSLTIQGNTYDMNEIERIVFDLDMYKHFRNDIYTTYKQIRHIHHPKACEKVSYEWLSNNLREHWLEQYLSLTLEEAKTVLHYANHFFGMAIK